MIIGERRSHLHTDKKEFLAADDDYDSRFKGVGKALNADQLCSFELPLPQ